MKQKESNNRNTAKAKIRVLVVEDSAVMQALLSQILSSDPAIEVIGKAKNGLEAIEYVKENTPDVITMDLNMPVMNGLLATRHIMETTPIPIIIVSDNVNPRDVNDTFRTLEAGAVSIINKPPGYGMDKNSTYKNELCQKVKLMSGIKLVRRISANYGKIPETAVKLEQKEILKGAQAKKEIQLIAIGASTGGPVVLEKILSNLPKSFSIPVIIVQHITVGFTSGLAEWLNATSSVPVKLPENGELILEGHCYIAPDNFHIKVNSNGNIILSDEPLVHNSKPSVSVLFKSAAEAYGANAVGILLTGMGRDGAEELKMMKDNGAITIAQNKESSIIYGMPGEAVKAEAAKFVLPPEGIISLLCELASK